MRGRDGKSYYDSAGNWSNPTWVEIKEIIDETITPAVELATGGSRVEEYVNNEVASRSFEWDCTYRYKKECDDEVYPALLAAFIAGTPLYMAFLDGPVATAGSKGWKAPILIDQMPQQRNLGDLVEVTVHGVAKLVCDNDVIRKAEAMEVGAAPATTTTTPGE
jgi:hypothetical protein